MCFVYIFNKNTFFNTIYTIASFLKKKWTHVHAARKSTLNISLSLTPADDPSIWFARESTHDVPENQKTLNVLYVCIIMD